VALLVKQPMELWNIGKMEHWVLKLDSVLIFIPEVAFYI
jgi:hypothetical protein